MITKLDDGRHLINGVELQYISGSLVGFFRLKHKDKSIEAENFNDFEGLFEYMKRHLKGYFTMGTLYNAFQEKVDGELLTTKNGLGHKVILSDSGGLQQARRGEKFSEETKNEIYLNQAMYSDLAMNFDEMPFKTIEANYNTGVNLNSTRCYIRDMIETSAKMSADEIRKQIEVFNTVEARAKIVPIIQGFRSNPKYFRGFGDNTYLDYARHIIDNIDNKDGHVGGLSFGGITVAADNRIGVLKFLQYIPATLWSKDIPAENAEHIHLLGVASPQRVMTLLSLVRAKLIDPRVKKISFDSTALTKAYTVGRVHKNREEFTNPEYHRPELTLKDYKDPTANNVRHYYKNVYNYFKDYEGFMFKSWEDLADHSQNNGSKLAALKQVEEKGGVGSEYHRKFLQQVRVCTLYATWCYLEAMEDYIDGVRTAADFPYGTDLEAIYHSIEHDIKDIETLHEVVEMHYSKVKMPMDFGVDTIEQYEEELHKISTHHEKGVQETNILFHDVDKLHDAHIEQKEYAKQRVDNNNFLRRSKKQHNDEHIMAKDITDSLF